MSAWIGNEKEREKKTFIFGNKKEKRKIKNKRGRIPPFGYKRKGNGGKIVLLSCADQVERGIEICRQKYKFNNYEKLNNIF